MTWHRLNRLAFFWAWVPLLVAFALIIRVEKRVAGTWLYPPLFILIGIPFLVADTLYNWTIGTIFWREWPREWLYTDRLIRKKAEGDAEAFRQCEILNRYDPGHC